MSYKAFFVEDEIVTREGIRDKVDWLGNGFEFCGDAPDGEVALPLLQTIQPDLLITDIKMPFMDGLELARIVRERLPSTKIIILSGHDEFEYARAAIQLGVTEYLLKPVTVQDIHGVLHKIAAELDRERAAQANLQRLENQVEENRANLRERLLLDIVVGAVTSAEAIEKAQALGIDLIAQTYLVVVIKIGFIDQAAPFDYHQCQRIQYMISALIGNDPGVFSIKKDLEEIVLIMEGDTVEALQAKSDSLMKLVTSQMNSVGCQLTIGHGTPKQRITDICASFVEALASIRRIDQRNGNGAPGNDVNKAELLKLNKSAVENYLKCGIKEDFDEFFDTFIWPLGESVLESSIVKDYIVMDVVLTTAKFLNDLGGNIDQVIPDLSFIEDIKTVEQIRRQVRAILGSALAFRDSQVTGQYVAMIQRASEYIDNHFVDPDLSLTEVASQANLSPSHFCTVFSQETGRTFKEYLTECRINKARELLRTTSLKSFEIAYQIGYNDPHYFSFVFRKHTGLTPKEFRWRAQATNAGGSTC